MSLKIVGGEKKGFKLFTPKTLNIRPATARVRDSVFNILPSMMDLKILDLFAGTGSMAFEALSRGASHATLVDIGDEAVGLLRKNIAKLDYQKQTQIIQKPANSAVSFLHKKSEQFDLIFIDPPYDQRLLKSCIQTLEKRSISHPDTLFISEHSPREKLNLTDHFKLVDERVYGQTIVSFFKES